MSSVQQRHNKPLVLRHNSELTMARRAAVRFLGEEHPIAQRLFCIIDQLDLDQETPTTPAFWGEEKDLIVGALQKCLTAPPRAQEYQAGELYDQAQAAKILDMPVPSWTELVEARPALARIAPIAYMQLLPTVAPPGVA